MSAGLFVIGCSSTMTKQAGDMDADKAASAQMERMLDQKNNEISKLKGTVGNLEQQLQSAKDQSMMAGAGTELLPPNAKPGECYARVYIPAQYATDTETVLKSDSSEVRVGGRERQSQGCVYETGSGSGPVQDDNRKDSRETGAHRMEERERSHRKDR
jgi:hypothetical protein